MSRTLACCIVLIGFSGALHAQTPALDANTPSSTLQINSRAVLVDVVVTDKNGNPVTGLKQDAFRVTEQGKPQTIGFFEEHTPAPAAALQMPKLPPDVFSNFSPFGQPAAVNVLLMDSLNTRIESQTVVHQQAMKFLKNLKPGSRMAVFTMDLGLHFVQGFTDDPALLFAALGNKKNNEVQSSVMLKAQEETNAQANLVGMMSSQVGGGSGATSGDPGMIEELKEFIQENDTAKETDRALLTMANLQRLATFLNGFPGRKNVIWFSESPSVSRRVDQQMEQEWQKTQNMLAAARVALYPVDARGVSTVGFYQADSVLPSSISDPSDIIGNPPSGASSFPGGSAKVGAQSPNGGSSASAGSTLAGNSPGSGGFSSGGAQSSMVMDEAGDRDAAQSMMKEIAADTGGRAFMNTNGLSDVMAKITADSADFYTLSYAPTDAKMDGTYRKIDVKIAGGDFNVSYRRGYFARDTGLPGGELRLRAQAIHKLAAENPGAVDPLLPFMDLGMPQSEQILYTAKIQPIAAKVDAGGAEQDKKSGGQSYTVDFSIALKDLDLKLDPDGLHKGMLNVSLLAYDKYGKVATRKENLVALNIKPDVYAVFRQKGVQLHTEVEVPKGQYWLRTGVYDQGSRKVGTMEIALDSVVPLPASIPLLSLAPLPVSTKDAAILPARPAEKITVEQLEQTLAAVKGKKDQDVAKRLGGMDLKERLSSAKLAEIEAGLPGEKSRLALLVMADASAFLGLPAAEIPTTAPPDVDTQRLILKKATDNVVASVQKFPDFFARQTTNRFHDLKLTSFSTDAEPIIMENQPFQPLDSYSSTVYYRNGQEVEEATQKHGQDKLVPRDGLVNWGVFGPLQRIVMTDIYKGKIGWGHWEQRATGPVAVFRYSIPKDKSDYVVKYCCLGFPHGELRESQSVPAFHGEIAIDAETGAVYRVVIFTDLLPMDPVFQADVMVEYEPVEIGGKTYICPSKSVSITRAVSPVFRQVCPAGVGVLTMDCTRPDPTKPKDTAINDTVYDSYHVFRSEVRIVPEGDAGPGDKTPATSPAPAPLVPPGL